MTAIGGAAPSGAGPGDHARPPAAPISLRALAALFLFGLALRAPIIAVGPLLPVIQADLGISHGVAGLLGTIPVLGMGFFAPLGPWVARRFGSVGAVGLCVTTIVAFGVVRSLVPGAPLVLLLTVGVGVGIGIAGAVAPIVVALRAPGHRALATGAYASGIVVGAALSGAFAVPLAGPGGDWRRSFAILSAATAVALLGWWLLRTGAPAERLPRARLRGLPWRSLTAWGAVLAFGLQSVVFYGTVAWMPSVFIERGWSAADAGALVAQMQGVGLVGTIMVPLLADRVGTRRSQLATASLVMIVALVGIIARPDLGQPLVLLLGLSLGALFPLVLTLPVDIARRSAEVGEIAAMTLLGGYVISALGPLALGLMRDLTGGFAASLWLLVVVAVLLFAVSLGMGPARLARGVAIRDRGHERQDGASHHA